MSKVEVESAPATTGPYVPQFMGHSISDESEQLLRKVRYALNRLTPENLNKLVADLTALEINHEKPVEVIFETSISHPMYSEVYAQFCQALSKMTVVGGSNEQVNFLELLISKCQKEFESDLKNGINGSTEHLIKDLEKCEDESKKKELSDLVERKLIAAKQRFLGNIRSIGELYRLGLLSEESLLGYVDSLQKDQSEENIECLCRLLSTVGHGLDTAPNAAKMSEYMGHVKAISKNKSFPSRIFFMAMDLIELRENQWKKRRVEDVPMKLDAIRAQE